MLYATKQERQGRMQTWEELRTHALSAIGQSTKSRDEALDNLRELRRQRDELDKLIEQVEATLEETFRSITSGDGHKPKGSVIVTEEC